MTYRHVTRPIVIACGLLCIDVTLARGQTAADLFNTQSLHELRLFINSRDLDELHTGFQQNTYYPADLHWNGVRVRNIAVRSRGSGSRNGIKLGLKLDFNRYTSGQTFLGFTSLVLDNLWQDPAMVREFVTMELFERMGLPAPREAFCRMYINDVFEGVYAIVEPIDTKFVSRTLGESGGYLFEYQFVAPFYGEDLGDDLSAYKSRFEPQNHESDADSVLYTPIRELFRAASEPDDATWRERLERDLDLPEFLTHVAIETYLSELDGLLGYAGMNNFYLYRFAGTTRHRLIVWDKDSTFYLVDSPIFLRADENVIFRRAMTFDDLRAFYLDALERTARSAAEDGWLEHEIDRVATLIGDAAHEDDRKQYSSDDFEAGLAFLDDFARKRSAFVLDQIALARQPVAAGEQVPAKNVLRAPMLRNR